MTKFTTCLLCAVLGLVALCGPAMAHPGGVNAPSSDLPPIVPDNEYLSPADVHARYAGAALEIVLTKIEHQPFAGTSFQAPDGERHHFESQLKGEGTCTGAACPIAAFTVNMNGPVDTVAVGRAPGQLGTFDTEMLSMSLTGGGIMIRESPTKASTGKTSIADIGLPGPGGPPADGYHIDSFFDVFTELSIDGGQTWMESVDASGASASTHVVLGIPEPASVALLALGLLGTCGFARRR